MTNQFTDEQVEAAAKAYWLASEREIHDKPITWEWDKEERRRYMWAARQVLAGVAPQADSVPTSKYISPHLPSMIRNLWKSDPSENSVRTALKLAGDLIQELIDLRAAPVQPSSTVDEGKLTQAIYDELMTDDAVSEVWSNGKVMATARRLAKFAVVEAIGGESHGE